MSTAVESSVSMEVHKEFEKRVDNNNSAIEHRLEALEREVSTTRILSESIAKMAASMEAMREEQHEMRKEVKDTNTRVKEINIELIENKIVRLDSDVKYCKDHIHELELKPQDSEDHEKRIRQLEAKPDNDHETRIGSLETRTDDQESRLRIMEGKPGKSWEKAVWLVITGIVTFVVGMTCQNLFGS